MLRTSRVVRPAKRIVDFSISRGGCRSNREISAMTGMASHACYHRQPCDGGHCRLHVHAVRLHDVF